MPRTVYTTTISLPKSMAKDIKAMTKQEGKTFSEFIRQAVHLYQIQHYGRRQQGSWEELRVKLKRISKYGRQIKASEFIAEDRYRH